MPYLVKKIGGELLDYNEGEVIFINNLKGEIGVDDFVSVGKLIAFTQNFSHVNETVDFLKETNYGLKNNTNYKLLEISY